jgi:hypothetical protein
MYEFPTIWFIYSVWACRRYRKGRRWCKACGCRRVCKAKVCSRRVCRRVRCTRRVCHTVIKYRIVKYKYRNPHYYGYGSRYLWGIKKIPYRVRVCKNVRSFCHKCYNRRYYCGRVCSHVCRYRKVRRQCVKVTGHPFWRFVKNRYCALRISPIFIKFSPNVSQCMQNMTKL